MFLSVSLHQCKRFIHLSLTLYNHRNQWHCQRTSLKNKAGWCRGHILDTYSVWTWIKHWLWQWVSWLEIFRGFPQSAHATASLVPILDSENWVPNHFQFTSYPIPDAVQPRIFAASLNKQKKCTLSLLYISLVHFYINAVKGSSCIVFQIGAVGMLLLTIRFWNKSSDIFKTWLTSEHIKKPFQLFKFIILFITCHSSAEPSYFNVNNVLDAVCLRLILFSEPSPLPLDHRILILTRNSVALI